MGQSFKKMWDQYCFVNGNGMNDPMRHEAGYHVSFIEEMAKVAEQVLTGATDTDGGPPGKRFRAADSGSSVGDGGLKEQLVFSIKAFQKINEEQKNTWNKYCDEKL